MQLRYGNYEWDANSVICKTECTPKLNTAGIPVTLVTRMTVTGSLLADPGTLTPNADLTNQQIAMQVALFEPYKDLVLLTNDEGAGVAASATLLTNAGSLSGVRLVAGPSFQGDRQDAEYAVQRKFSFAMEVETLYSDQLSTLVSFTESIAFSGGMPMRTICRSVNMRVREYSDANIIEAFQRFAAWCSWRPRHSVAIPARSTSVPR